MLRDSETITLCSEAVALVLFEEFEGDVVFL